MTTIPKDLIVLPGSQRLYVGIDVAKASSLAGFVTQELLLKRRFDRCPSLHFKNTRSGFEELIKAMCHFADDNLNDCVVLLEKTGHYHLALVQFLQEQGIEVYEVAPTERMGKGDKTDKLDALKLANAAYSQIEFGIQVLDESQRIRPALPLPETTAELRSLVRRRYELVHDATQRKNRLIAICDELFPEFVEVIKDPNGPSALNIRFKFPTPAQIASADIEDLYACRTRTRPSNADLERLQALAKQTIGAKNPGRIAGLITEQRQLIDELRLLNEHREALEAEIARLIAGSREGQILLSLPAMAPLAAATIIAGIGNIANFEKASQLRSYSGWSPVRTQTGTTKDSAKLTRGGQRPLKQAMYFTVWQAIKTDTEFKAVYDRLVQSRCQWDERLQRHVGKNKVVGRICGQYVGLIYTLLRQDYNLLANVKDGEAIPEPTLYSRELHRAHRTSHIHRGSASNQ